MFLFSRSFSVRSPVLRQVLPLWCLKTETIIPGAWNGKGWVYDQNFQSPSKEFGRIHQNYSITCSLCPMLFFCLTLKKFHSDPKRWWWMIFIYFIILHFWYSGLPWYNTVYDPSKNMKTFEQTFCGQIINLQLFLNSNVVFLPTESGISSFNVWNQITTDPSTSCTVSAWKISHQSPDPDIITAS